MPASQFVGLKCDAAAVNALATGLRRFGATGGEPQWLVSAAWLCTAEQDFLATACVEVLADGFLARSLRIQKPNDFVAKLEAELLDVSVRLLSHGNGDQLPAAAVPAIPASLMEWPAERYATHVLVRWSERERATHRIACALQFTQDDGRSLLIAADPSTLAIVLSEDDELIAAYRNDCEALSPAQYLSRVGA
jgi:hypothetical protein